MASKRARHSPSRLESGRTCAQVWTPAARSSLTTERLVYPVAHATNAFFTSLLFCTPNGAPARLPGEYPRFILRGPDQSPNRGGSFLEASFLARCIGPRLARVTVRACTIVHGTCGLPHRWTGRIPLLRRHLHRQWHHPADRAVIPPRAADLRPQLIHGDARGHRHPRPHQLAFRSGRQNPSRRSGG